MKIKCQTEYCINNNNGLCIAEEIYIGKYGICNSDYKPKSLKEIISNFFNWLW